MALGFRCLVTLLLPLWMGGVCVGAQRGSTLSCSWTRSFLESIAYGVVVCASLWLRSMGAGTSSVCAFFLKYVDMQPFNLISALGSQRGAEGEMAMAALPRCAASSSYIRRCPFVSLYSYEKSKELPATTDGEWRRRHSLQSHKGGPETVPFYFKGVFQRLFQGCQPYTHTWYIALGQPEPIRRSRLAWTRTRLGATLGWKLLDWRRGQRKIRADQRSNDQTPWPLGQRGQP